MEIVCCTDNNFIMPCGVMLRSLSLNNKEEEINANVIIDNSVTEENKGKLLSTISDNDKHRITFHLINSDFMDKYPSLGVVSPHVTKATYYRLFMTDLLPETINKVIYLDCDLVVRHSLSDLWNTDLGDKAIACVMDQCDRAICNYNRLRINPELGYFNAGVQLMNIKLWREENLVKRFEEYIRTFPERILFHDQDVMNAIFQESKINLPLKYNVQTSFYHKIDVVEFNYWKHSHEIENAIRDPFILHFSSGLKPWFLGCEHPMKKEFLKYKDMTVWADEPLKKKSTAFKTKIKHFLENIGFICKEPSLYRNSIEEIC